MLAQLAVAAHFFEPLDDRLQLRVGLELYGLEGSVSSYATHAEIYSPSAPKVGDTVYSANSEYGVTSLATDPRDAVRQLLDPLFITIVDHHHDVVAALKRH